MMAGRLLLASAVLGVSVVLQGCGGGGTTPAPTPAPAPPGPTPATPVPTPDGPTPSPTTPAPTPKPTSTWKLNPIEVRGQHLFDSVTGKEFFGKGIGMPNLKEDLSEWIKVLHRIRADSKEINLVRLYELPACAANSTACLTDFMRAADDLEMYVLVPGSGTIWGYYPRKCAEDTIGGPSVCCKDANDCYKAGGLLGWGQTMLQNFNFPNTLALVVGNEFDQQTPEFMATIKGYTRDLKSYMKMCDDHKDSPSKGQMRQIPLLYASSDDSGDTVVKLKADYLFCDSGDEDKTSIDIFGLNIERWCAEGPGKISYTGVQDFVSKAKYPGAFVFSEMGCRKDAYKPTPNRDWAQVPGIFTNFDAVGAFIAYTYYGNKDFNMFDGPTSEATIFPDGQNFYNQLKLVGDTVKHDKTAGSRPTCPTVIKTKTLDTLASVAGYDTGKAGYPASCPKPPAPKKPSSFEIAI